MVTEIFGKSTEKASRLELFKRVLYGAIISIIVGVYSFVITLWAMPIILLCTLNWFYILFFGKRWNFAIKHTTNFVNFVYGKFYFDYIYKKVYPYLFLLTDKRPGFYI